MAIAIRSRFGRRHKPCSVCRKSHPVWWNSSKGRWFLSIEKEDGGYRQVNLGSDHDEALAQWHRIEAGLESVEPAASAPAQQVGGEATLVGELAELFLANHERKISAERFRITTYYINEFVSKFGGVSVASLRVGGVNRVEAWIASKKTWTSDGDPVSRVKQLFNWSAKNGYIASSPIKAMEKGKWGQRVGFFSAEQEAAIYQHGSPEFVVAFRFLVLTGCRPEEVISLTKDNVHEDKNGLFLMVDHKNQKYTEKQRRVFLTPEAAEIIQQQLKKYPSGRLFRSGNRTRAKNGERQNCSVEYFNKALRDLCEKPELRKLGLNDCVKVGENNRYKYVPYTARHTFAVRYLTGFYHDSEDEPIVLGYGEVAAFLGNSATMVEKVYGHLVDQTEFLSSRLNGTFKKRKAK